jgi:hypothetical protein
MQQEVNKSSQEKGNTLEVSSTKGFRVERRRKMKGREERCSANGNASIISYFINMHLGPKGGVWFKKLYVAGFFLSLQSEGGMNIGWYISEGNPYYLLQK